MDRITIVLYVNTAIYYIISFLGPILGANKCGEGINPISHFVYLAYSITNMITEVVFVLRIQQCVNDPDLLKFNKWHFCELIMGQIARFDFYMDMCFLVMAI